MANVELAVDARTGLDRQLPLLLVLMLLIELMWLVCMLWDRMTGGVGERSDAEDEPAKEGCLLPEGGGASEQLMVLTLARYPCCG